MLYPRVSVTPYLCQCTMPCCKNEGELVNCCDEFIRWQKATHTDSNGWYDAVDPITGTVTGVMQQMWYLGDDGTPTAKGALIIH